MKYVQLEDGSIVAVGGGGSGAGLLVAGVLAAAGVGAYAAYKAGLLDDVLNMLGWLPDEGDDGGDDDGDGGDIEGCTVGSISGATVNSALQTIGGATVKLYTYAAQAGAQPTLLQSVTSSSNGAYSLTDIPVPGLYSIEATHADYGKYTEAPVEVGTTSLNCTRTSKYLYMSPKVKKYASLSLTASECVSGYPKTGTSPCYREFKWDLPAQLKAQGFTTQTLSALKVTSAMGQGYTCGGCTGGWFDDWCGDLNIYYLDPSSTQLRKVSSQEVKENKPWTAQSMAIVEGVKYLKFKVAEGYTKQVSFAVMVEWEE